MADDVTGRVMAAVSLVLNEAAPDSAKDFYDLGAASLEMVHIAELVAADCGVPVTVWDVIDAPDLGSFVSLVRDRVAVAAGAAAGDAS